MNLDPHTLLFSLILTDFLMVLCLLFAVYGRIGGNKRDGMGLWAIGVFLEMMVWVMAESRWIIPNTPGIIFALGLKAASNAMILAAIYEFQQRRAPRWMFIAPVLIACAIAVLTLNDLRMRYFWSSLIFIPQILLIAHALLSDQTTREGKAWKLMLTGIVMMVLVLTLRAGAALLSHGELAQPDNNLPLNPAQLIAFIAVMMTSLLGTIGFILLVKERTDREIMHLAMTDSLTRIPNRHALIERAEQALMRRSGAPLAFMMIDVDHFKLINDKYGHPAGDEVLRSVAALLAERLRKQDMLGRYGGEEFCVIAPDTELTGALTLAEALRETISAASFVTETGTLSVSISIGISLCPANAKRELKDMLAEADAALYSAKRSGRNRVVSHDVHSLPTSFPENTVPA